MITGESIPVSKKVGSPLIGGTINQHGLLRMETHKVSSGCMPLTQFRWEKIRLYLKSSSLSLMHKILKGRPNRFLNIHHLAHSLQLADKISGYFVPVVILLSILTFIVWDVLTGLEIIPPEDLTYCRLFSITNCE